MKAARNRLQNKPRRRAKSSPNLNPSPPPQMRMDHRQPLFEMPWKACCCLKNRVWNFLLSRLFPFPKVVA
jgi:hypothetical protein